MTSGVSALLGCLLLFVVRDGKIPEPGAWRVRAWAWLELVPVWIAWYGGGGGGGEGCNLGFLLLHLTYYFFVSFSLGARMYESSACSFYSSRA